MAGFFRALWLLATWLPTKVLRVINWAGKQFNASSKWASGFGFLVLWGVGMTFIQVDEYFFALVSWIAASFVLFSKGIHRQGNPAHPKRNVVVKASYIAAALLFIPISILWIQAKRGNKRWTEMPVNPEAKFTGIPSADEARVDITNIVAVPPLQATSSGLHWFLNIFYKNNGKLPAQGTAHRTVTVLSVRELSENEIKAYEKHADNLPFKPNSADELPPNDPKGHYFSIPNSPSGKAAQVMSGEYGYILEGKKRLYLFITAKYKDQSMPTRVVGVTEFCGWFSGTFEAWHNCGENRSYLERLH